MMEFMWDSLVCKKCTSISFVQAMELRWRKGAGTTVNPAGKYICVGCGDSTDVLSMIKAMEVTQREKELEALRAAD